MHKTPYPDVNDVISILAEGLQDVLGEKLVGLYLVGSLAYGGFDRGSSDIDFLAVMRSEVMPDERKGLIRIHEAIGAAYPEWRERTQCSYVTVDMLSSIEPPPQPRPYVNQGAMWDPDPEYGYEWLMDLHSLRATGIAVLGPEPNELVPEIPIELVRDASRKDFRKEWLPLLDDPTYLDLDHHQAFVTLTLCRILHREHHDGIVSKREASAWVKQRYEQRWRDLVDRAERWEHGEKLDAVTEIQDFIRFVRVELAQAESACA